MIPKGMALCLICGRSGRIVGPSLDPQHPMINCYWDDAEGGHGHGIRPGTLIQDESDAIQIMKREKRQINAHRRGSHVKGRWPYCPVCRAAKAAASTASPGPSTAARSAAGETVQEVQE